MSDASARSDSPSCTTWRERAGLCAAVLILTLVLIRAPAPIEADPLSTYRTLLYESLRLGQGWGDQFITTDGPLGALQSPGYLKGSVWMAMLWQIAGNLLLAGLFVGAAFRLPRYLKWWALAFLLGLLASVPVLAPWLAMVLLGHDLIHRRQSTALYLTASAAALGFLALSSLGHLLLGLLSLLLAVVIPRPTTAKLATVFSFGGAYVAGWLVLGQSFPGLGRWLARALPLLVNTSELLRPTDRDPMGLWAGLATFALVVILFQRSGSTDDRRKFLAPGLFLLGATWLAWKTIALQAYGLTEIFFSTSILAGFIFLHQNSSPKWAGFLIALAVGGLIRRDPLLVTDAIGQINRQIVVNVRMLGALPQLRSNLLAQVKANYTPEALPLIKAAVGNGTVDVLGESPGRAILCGLNVHLRPAPFNALVRSPELASLNGAYLAGKEAPAFVLQSLQAHGELAPGFEDAPAQLALYQHYDLQLEEKGVMLWRKKVATPETRSLAASGELAFGESLHLPANGTAYWLELDVSPSLFGRAWGLLDENPEPGLLVRDAAGTALRYPLLPAVSGGGFLIDPFVRGEVDFLRRQSGASIPRVTEISVLPPPRGSWLWAKHFSYRLYAISGITSASSLLPDKTAQTYRLLNRPPLSVAYKLPFDTLPTEQGDFILFAHPSSTLEFAVTKADYRVRAQIGILPGASQGLHPTDGVDFSVEFLGQDGVRHLLYHRWLDPVANPIDQGRQDFTVDLPPAHEGRLFLRTSNPPGRNESYDWAFWSYVVIE